MNVFQIIQNGFGTRSTLNRIAYKAKPFKDNFTFSTAGTGAALLTTLGIALPMAAGVSQPQAGLVLTGSGSVPDHFAAAFIAAIGQHRHWSRSHLAAVPA